MEEKPNRRNGTRTLLTFAILLLGLFVGFRLGRMNSPNILIPPKWNKLDVILDYADKNYVDSISVPDLIEKAIPEVLKNLDPHSVYISASEMQGVNEELEGNFDGIGVYFTMPNDTVIITNVIIGGPSEKVGLEAGDRIVRIDKFEVAGHKIDQDSIVKRLKGKAGTKVIVEVKRMGISSLIPFTIMRGKIPLKSVDVAYMVNATVGYIKMSKFARETHKEFVEAVNKLHKQGMTKIIVDLRDNTGGFLEQAFEIANEFIPKGKMIVYTEGRARERENYYSNGRGLCLKDEVVILINESSASASEILAGAIQDNDRGTIVGRRSFGKGLVQEQRQFKDSSGIRLTIARYYTPTGRSIQRPYTEGKDDYYEDMARRYAHGEFKTADSIHQDEGLRFETPGGKVVYGGGGITPDVFVSIDTVGVNRYFTQLVSKNLIYRYVNIFSDKNRKQLNELKDIASLKRFLDRQNLLNSFVAYAAQQGVSPKNGELKECSNLILARLQASIGRNTSLEDDGFFPFIAPIDNVLQEAVKLFEQNK